MATFSFSFDQYTHFLHLPAALTTLVHISFFSNIVIHCQYHRVYRDTLALDRAFRFFPLFSSLFVSFRVWLSPGYKHFKASLNNQILKVLLRHCIPDKNCFQGLLSLLAPSSSDSGHATVKTSSPWIACTCARDANCLPICCRSDHYAFS